MGGRRLIKAAAILAALGYCSLLIYQSGVTFNIQERTPEALQGSDLVEPLTKVSVNDSVSTKHVTVNDVFISVKTSKFFHNTRLPVILKTWFQMAKDQTWFFTDDENQSLQKITGGHMINTKCSASHQRIHLCCKMSVEYDHFLDSGKKWFCHFDDDNYVNVPQLVTTLQKYDYQKDWYLGKPSIGTPVKYGNISFWFATGGAGFCLSKSLAFKMYSIASGGKFISICEKVSYPDDVTMGYLIEILMKTKLTYVPEFHSHFEQMKLLAPETFKDQISFSYHRNKTDWNVVYVPGFDRRFDPTRFMSLHCFLFPGSDLCQEIKRF